jgi:hypothetical protein
MLRPNNYDAKVKNLGGKLVTWPLGPIGENDD